MRPQRRKERKGRRKEEKALPFVANSSLRLPLFLSVFAVDFCVN
jgi:hypothetical protein